MSRTSGRKPDNPAPSAPPPDPGAAPHEGREANGRFARGNQGGPGNPFARKTAAFRRQLMESVTQQDMDAIWCATKRVNGMGK